MLHGKQRHDERRRLACDDMAYFLNKYKESGRELDLRHLQLLIDAEAILNRARNMRG